jgi:hypothetical protein
VHHEERSMINNEPLSHPELISMRSGLPSELNLGSFSQPGSRLCYSETEDFLQCLMTPPPRWLESIPANMLTPIDGESGFPASASPMPNWDGQDPGLRSGIGPQAIESVASMITYRVSKAACYLRRLSIHTNVRCMNPSR